MFSTDILLVQTDTLKQTKAVVGSFPRPCTSHKLGTMLANLKLDMVFHADGGVIILHEYKGLACLTFPLPHFTPDGLSIRHVQSASCVTVRLLLHSNWV